MSQGFGAVGPDARLRSNTEYRVSGIAMDTVALPDGTELPAIGLGTWEMGESARTRATAVAAVRLAIGIGYRVIDLVEMYGGGGAEEDVEQAVADALRVGRVTRDELFSVSKIYPHNAVGPVRAPPASAAGRGWGSIASISTCCIGPVRIHCGRRSPGSRHFRRAVAYAIGASVISAPTRCANWMVLATARHAPRIRCVSRSARAASNSICCRGSGSARCH